MLAQTIVLLAMVFVLALSGAATLAGYARTNSAAAAKALVPAALEQALAGYERYVAQTIAGQVSVPSGGYASAPAPIAALNGGTPWVEQTAAPYQPDPTSALVVATDVLPTAQSVPACSGATNSGPDLEQNAQCSPFVQESRLSLTITTTVGTLAPGGTLTPLAANRVTATLRLFAQAPYASLVGVQDAETAADPHEGDVGGSPDTTLHVNLSCVPGTGNCAFSSPPPTDATATLPWTNGNGQP